MQSVRASPEILQRIQLILRRDLKLGPDAQIPSDMPFLGGDFDLDSLDILLMVTSIEKEFGIAIPSEAVGRDAFRNVATLAAYVQEQLARKAATPAAAPDPLALLPHADPFRFVSKLTAITEGVSAEGIWKVSGDEPFFAGHFPGNPIVPGVLIAEALAQLSGLATPSAGASGKLAQIDVRFESPVIPPAEIILQSKLTRTIGSLQQFEVSASVTGAVVARGTLTLHRAAGGPA